VPGAKLFNLRKAVHPRKQLTTEFTENAANSRRLYAREIEWFRVGLALEWIRA